MLLFNPLSGRFEYYNTIGELNADYARLDGTNQPFTGNLNISKADPEIRLTDTGDSTFARLKFTDTGHLFSASAEVLGIGGIGNAISLNGTTQFGFVANNVNHDIGTGDFSFLVWVKTTQVAGNYKTIISKSSLGNTNGRWFLCCGTSNLSFGITFITSGIKSVAIPWTAINDGVWHSIVCTVDRDSTTGMRMEIDAVSVGTPQNILASVADNLSTTNGTMLGGWSASEGGTTPYANTYFGGLVDEVCIWKGRALTHAEIVDIHNGGAGCEITAGGTFATAGTPMGTNLISAYHLNSTTGNTAVDSISAINLALTNTNDSNWVTGIVPEPGVMSEVTAFQVSDGGTTDETATIKVGCTSGRLTNNGITHRNQINGVEQYQLIDGALVPTTDNDIDLGASALEFKNIYLDGVLYVDEIQQQDNEKHYWGTGNDASQYYDGTYFYTNAGLVAASDWKVICGANKTIELQNVVYDDLQFYISAAKVPAANYPDWGTFTTNTSAYAFDIDDYIDCQHNEVFHMWKQGTAANFHLHLALRAAQTSGSNKYAKFSLWVSYADTSEVYVEPAVLTYELTIPTASAALTHFYLDMGDLVLTNNLVGTQINCRIKRIASTGGGGTNEYADHIFVTQVGAHLEKDTMGSRQEIIK
jgi:hypothetical protein